MGCLHDVLRYLLARVPHGTQAEHDQVAASIDKACAAAHADPPATPAPSEETSS